MASTHRTSPPSLSERRGKPELQQLHSRHSSRPSTSTRSINPQSSTSSFSSSNRSFPTISNTSDAMSTPATPTEAQWYAMDSLPESCEFCGPEYGLGLSMDDITRRAEQLELSGGIRHTASGYSLPPTPPHHGHQHIERCNSPVQNQEQQFEEESEDEQIFYQGLPSINSTQPEFDDYTLDADAFATLNFFDPAKTAPVANPQIPPTRPRRTTLLEKMFPQRFREGIRRRMSSQSNSISSMPTPPAPIVTPNHTPPLTPPTDDTDIFWPLNTTSSSKSTPPKPDYDFELPMEIIPKPSHPVYSPLQSPRSKPTFTGSEVFPELSRQPQSREVVHSPLQPPKIAPFMSYSDLAASQSSLSIIPPSSDLYTVPSIDPTSPKPCRKLSDPIDTMSPSTVTQMIDAMVKDEETYTWMIERMKNHGWSSAEEIHNLESQRDESKQKWQRKINGAKRVLAGLNKCGYPAFQFPDRSTKSMESVRSDYSTLNMGPYINAGPGAQFHRTYSQ